MYDLLIVDDESIERRGVALLLKKLGTPVNIYEAANGKQALHLLAEHPARIVITDIRMPIMDGLELSRQIASMYPDSKIIIYSAFGEFDYAREAISSGVSNYLLKPIEVNELKSVMDSILELCKNEDEAKANRGRLERISEEFENFRRQKMLGALLRPSHDSELHKAASAWFLAQKDMAPAYLFLVKNLNGVRSARDSDVRGLWNAVVNMPNDYLHLTDNESLCFVYPGQRLSSAKISAIGERLLEKIWKTYSERLFIIVSQEVSSPGDISINFTKMDDAEDYTFFMREGGVILIRDGYLLHNSTVPFDEGMIDCIYEDAVYRDFSKLRKDFSVLVKSLKHSSGFSPLYIKSLLSALFGKLCGSAGVLPEKDARVILKEIAGSSHIDTLLTYIESQLSDLEQSALKNASDSSIQNGVQTALKIIYQEYAEPLLSLEYLAERVYLSRSYLSAVFKRETGLSVSKYISSYRLEKAAHLLLTTNIKVTDIGLAVGFSSDSYFVSVFGGHYGQSPSKFRKSKGKAGALDA